MAKNMVLTYLHFRILEFPLIHGKIHGTFMGKQWENSGKYDSPVDDSPLENHGKFMGTSWKIMDSPSGFFSDSEFPDFQSQNHTAIRALGSAHRAPIYVPVACSKGL